MSEATAPGTQRAITIDEALRAMVGSGASDLHITVGVPPMIRRHGSLVPLPGALPWGPDDVRREVFSLMSEEQREEFERDSELDFAHALDLDPRDLTLGGDERGGFVRFRVNVYRQRGSVGAVFRHVPVSIRTLRELGVPGQVGKFAELPRGLVLVTGPTGSGKTTTLAALIDKINRERQAHIMTIEDPIEFLHTHRTSIVNQREVGNDTESFHRALRQVLRQDPDVILVGEMRDLETISVALTAAETGHLVFATLHTQSAPQTIDRIIDVFPPHQQTQVRTQLASTLRGVVCQSLVPRADGEGRVVATEVLVTTPAVSNLIREAQTYQIPAIMQAGAIHGMHTLDQDLARLVDSGVVTHRAAEEFSSDREALRQLTRRSEGAISEEPVDIDFNDAFSTPTRRSRR
ncbi:type IV pilus twitching motility protein PilT [Microbacterium album]|uniref:Twitching motility protein PilT n=1 Tax=Microbacterium album TaxID=2053191 RepID=A0A917IGN0_9MICO|nr:type IV pilus twitching motility protein PilT [Microbacterium album]GGH50399.1 twitching motility protein PilT [Microbacterium album]